MIADYVRRQRVYYVQTRAYYYAGFKSVTGVSTNPRGDQPNINTDKALFQRHSRSFAWANINQDGLRAPGMDQKFRTPIGEGWYKSTGKYNNTVSVSAGSDKVKAYGGLFGYLNNGGVIKGQSFQRYTAKANVDFNATNWLTFGNSMTVRLWQTVSGQSNAGSLPSVTQEVYMNQPETFILTRSLRFCR